MQNLGTIDVAPRALVTIVTHCVHQSDDVIGMASKRLVNGFAKLLTRTPHPGIDVRVDPDGITVEIYVIIAYGAQIRTVAEQLQIGIKEHLERAISLPVKEVNVMVQGVQAR